ncbi:hypothetical protein B0H16DRAFT_1898115 [Mycena metata]|uniref:C2H2-type domain-containing protein n=1 Tax=Mycena metata TaxID=1033252 RepID=A0AAD7HCB2_9AGAR|nr:hypothetical protein B0H16DRAFT_1898115 [Mycena metata]
MAQCNFCNKNFNSWANVARHKQKAPDCRRKASQNLDQVVKRLQEERRAKDLAKHTRRSSRSKGVEPPSSNGARHSEFDAEANFDQEEDPLPFPPQENDGDESDAVPPVPPAPGAGAETGTGSGRKYWRRGSTRSAGATYGEGKTKFEIIRDEEILKGAEVLGPFKDEAEWELAKWLIKHVGHGAADEFLKLSIIADRAKPSYKGKNQFFDKIDDLPGGVKWQCKEMDVKGDLPDHDKDPTGATMRGETVELWWRDPVECVRELIGNPMFRDVMRFAPEELYEDEEGNIRVYNEMWTGDWWQEIQKRLPLGATVAPLILSSDKTMLSNFRGDNSAWPVYLTIGNIGKETRRQVSAHATVLIGYLPIPKFDCFDKNTRSLAKYRLFHECMTVLLASVVEAGKTGTKMVCADNLVRDVWPIFAAYVADYPEQCLVACCKENRCPLCTVSPDERGDHLPHDKRDQMETLFLMARQQDGEKDTAFEKEGIRAVYPPFWMDLPHSDIFQAFTPDLLHQLHKGVFKDHLVKWCTEIIGKGVVDERFRQMPDHPGLRHFKNGISSVSQWTGTEHKEMEKVFLGLAAAGADAEMVQAVRALMDFAYLASLQSHTTTTLLALRTALDDFHTHKNIFIKLGGRKENFNIPKMHSLEHYDPAFQLFGSADGFNTESPERLHIDYAKNAYRASNRKDYIIQMTLWLQRQEAVARFTAFREWYKSTLSPTAPLTQLPNTLPIAHAAPSASAAPAVDDADTLIHHTYSIAKRPPAATRRVVASHIISKEGHNAIRFLPALSHFLLTQLNVDYTPYHFDVFPTWKRLKFTLPNIPEVGSRHSTNLVRATAPVLSPGEGRYRAVEPAYHDFALVKTAEANAFTDGTALHGLRIAQVRVIFQLPSHYPVKSTQPLAYIEWFTPLRTPNTLDGYYHVNRSTRKISGQDGPYSEIVPVDRIVRNAMLIPYQFDQDKKFRVNSHIDGHSFCMFKLGLRDCLPV